MAEPFLIVKFLGLNEKADLIGDPRYTSSLDNVEVRHGRVLGTLGIDELNSITTVAANTPIIGLMTHYTAGGTGTVLRMTPDRVESLGASSWTNITGTVTLAGSSAKRPQWTNIDGSLVATNEGAVQPFKWTGTGNIALIGGTPPYAKALVSYVGFLMLGNISDDGTFTDIAAGPFTVRYTDDWDTDWDTCRNNELILDETPGEIRCGGVIGRTVAWGKSDGIIVTRWVGGSTQFAQEKLDFDNGVIAPLSWQVVNDNGAIFLATDMELYFTDGQHVKPLPPNVTKTLQETEDISKAKDVVATLEPDKELYHLYYHRTGGTWLDGRISYNYRTGEFFKRSYAGHAFTRAAWYRASNTAAVRVIASTTDLVYQMDSGQDDNGTRKSAYYDTDWQVVPGRLFQGVDLVFKRKVDCRCRVSMAKDFDPTFRLAKTYDLRGNNVSKEETRVQYRPPPQVGDWFNVRIELLNDGSTNVPELRAILPPQGIVPDQMSQTQIG